MFLEARLGDMRWLCKCSACHVSGVVRAAGGERPCRKAAPWALLCVANAGSRGAGLEPKASGLPAKCSLSQSADIPGRALLELGDTVVAPFPGAHTRDVPAGLCAGDPGDVSFTGFEEAGDL